MLNSSDFYSSFYLKQIHRCRFCCVYNSTVLFRIYSQLKSSFVKCRLLELFSMYMELIFFVVRTWQFAFSFIQGRVGENRSVWRPRCLMGWFTSNYVSSLKVGIWARKYSSIFSKEKPQRFWHYLFYVSWLVFLSHCPSKQSMQGVRSGYKITNYLLKYPIIMYRER